MTTSKLVKPHTPHPTPHTLPPPKSFFGKPYLIVCWVFLGQSNRQERI
ncbi:MAG: hypothetical protein PX481_24505 [Microcystis sp. M53603_WE2]|nr:MULTISPECIES: hypothetical protein [unclassified Microcystis]MCE2664228.1 hypothetical protein [Microcystis sp. 53602_E8]MDJ0527132.1 hypothetical protein [Microcystis sp. M53600_WE12]MDJ0541781.1 hypothetical protein [Microcystis sp. M53603_WE2]MDJ0607092.1 hypothetical protein [Microcystis sp. M53602_WE12]